MFTLNNKDTANWNWTKLNQRPGNGNLLSKVKTGHQHTQYEKIIIYIHS